LATWSARSVYRRIHALTPRGAKRAARGALELLFDAGRRTHYSQFGEDAFLQGYFEAKAFAADPSLRLPFKTPRLGGGAT